MRRAQTWLSTLVLALGLAGAADARTGVVLVHGKGGSDLASVSKARAYWTEPMISAVTKGYTVPHLICHYDGTQYMWVAGNQVAVQIYDWMMANGIDDIVIDTHSYGGVVVRWILSNPTWDWRYQPIINRLRWVNAIAGPHRGSEAADLAGTLSGSWLTGWLVDLVGQDTDSTRNLRTDWMAYYNQYWLKGTAGRPSLPRTIWTIAGTGLWNDFAHSEDYGLATLSGVAGLPGEDDGMVAQYSAEGVGIVWFRTAANHHHNRRNDYRQIGTTLATDY